MARAKLLAGTGVALGSRRKIDPFPELAEVLVREVLVCIAVMTSACVHAAQPPQPSAGATTSPAASSMAAVDADPPRLPPSKNPATTRRDLWMHPMSLAVWPATFEGRAPHSRLEVLELSCEIDATRHPEQVSCHATPPGSVPTALPERVAQCFDIARVPLDDSLLAAVQARVRKAAGEGFSRDDFQDLARTQQRYVALRLKRISMVQELRGVGCENRPPPDPKTGAMVGCDPVAVPTGRMERGESIRTLWLAPSGPANWAPFQPTTFEAFWNHVGWYTGHEGTFAQRFRGDPLLAPSEGGVPPPDQALRFLLRYPLQGPPEVRAAVLADTAIAAVLVDDRRHAHEATAQLGALVRAGSFDGRKYGTEATLRSLEAIDAGAWLSHDPCAAK